MVRRSLKWLGPGLCAGPVDVSPAALNLALLQIDSQFGLHPMSSVFAVHLGTGGPDPTPLGASGIPVLEGCGSQARRGSPDGVCLSFLTEADWKPQVVVLPIPVPIFVPVPMNMYCQKVPVPFSMPVPVSAVPCVSPTPAHSSFPASPPLPPRSP